MRLRGLRSREAEVVALVNSGYETSRPEMLLPAPLARQLGLYPALPQGSEVREYVLADGTRARLVRIPDALEVSVVTEDRVVGPVKCDAAVAEGAEEPLIGDKLADALSIVALAIGEGLWCFRDELGRRTRRSAG